MEDDRDRQLRHLQGMIRLCTQCVEAGFLPEANPVFRGHAGLREMIVGQAPGPRAARAGVPWSGASGNLLKGWLARAGFDSDAFLETWYFTSLTRCFPGKAKSGSGDRVPSVAERALCRPYLEQELALIQPGLIVTLGRLATNALIPEARSFTLRQLVGRVYELDFGYGAVQVVPLPHPSGVGRWLNDPDNRDLVEQAVTCLASIRAAGLARSVAREGGNQ